MDKTIIRQQIWELLFQKGVSENPFNRIPTFIGQNKAAEKLRQIGIYKKAHLVMITPDDVLRQVRFNALMDRKKLLIPSPGFKKGFYLLTPKGLHPRLWSKAVKGNYLTTYGRKIPLNLTIGKIDLLITGAVAVDKQGGRLGKGTGLFDLEYAILKELGWIETGVPIVVLVHEFQIVEKLFLSPNDVPVDYIVTPQRVIKINSPYPRPQGIDWSKLSLKQIKRLQPLWELKFRGK